MRIIARIVSGIIAIGFVSCANTGTVVTNPPPVLLPPGSVCADFSTRADDTSLGTTFQLPPPPGFFFTFSQVGPPTPFVMFFNRTAGEVGLQFTTGGLEVTLSTPKSHVVMRVGTFPAPIKVTAFDGLTFVSSQTINTANTYTNVTINAPVPFTKLVFKGGNNEATLVWICVY
jgi:hypothetical protein